MAKNTKCFNYDNLHNHRGLKVFRRQYIFAEKLQLSQKSSFDPTTIFAMNLKLYISTCFFLS